MRVLHTIKGIVSLAFVVVVFASCVKNYKCHNCGNKSPIAEAGNDTTIKLPTNRVILDAKASYDPDGHIISYHWIRRTGRGPFHITQENNMQTEVKDLEEGEHIFQLEVKDDDLQISLDLIVVYVMR